MSSKIIVIPIYKSSPDKNEKMSFIQCIKILNKHRICIVSYKDLDLSCYTDLLISAPADFTVKYFDRSFFENLAGYNKLMLSFEFYHTFKEYDYMLLYQLDAWVFRDELDYWCQKGYDYIGAPWIDMNILLWLKQDIYPKKLYYYHKLFGNGRFISKVGNGGFSLRKVKSIIASLKRYQAASLKWKANEDSFFSHYVKSFSPRFQIASKNEAIMFGFDLYPQKAFILNNMKLPFGCHAWASKDAPYENNFSFWKDKIS